LTPAARESFRERRRRRRGGRRQRRRAIYLLPNLITSTGLMLGFWSITLSIRGEFEKAALAIVLAMICDLLDGRVARATMTSSRFGVEFDSLSDLTAFGLAPALLMYNWTLLPLGPRGWLIAGLFALCTALRLARFNAKADDPNQKHFQGIASTFAGGMVAATVWFVGYLDYAPPFPRPVGIAITSFFALLALLMVSTIPYPSVKSIKIEGRRAYPTLVALLVFLVVVLLNHETMLFALGLLYLCSGPVLWWIERHKPKVESVASEHERESLGDVR
jgi:CDP-diacylglycerol--serine O-phosphatidyltransferase